MLNKITKLVCFLTVICGLNSCEMFNARDDQEPAKIIYDQQMEKPSKQIGQNTATSSASSRSEPVQKTTPGPKRAAAPQLPVIE